MAVNPKGIVMQARSVNCECSTSYTCGHCMKSRPVYTTDWPAYPVTYKGKTYYINAVSQKAAQHIASHRERHGYKLFD